MRVLDTVHLFTGVDGLGLGMAKTGRFRTVAFSEYEDAPSRVLAHHHPDVPNLGDITTIDWTGIRVGALTGGFPCQDVSKAGRGAGIKEGTRSGLWFEYVRAIRDLRPGLVIVENVSALLGRGMDIVLGDLAALGFDAWWTCLRASDVGAAHRRERVFIVAVAADGDLLGRLHGEAGLVPAEAGVHAQRHVAAGGHEDAPHAPSPERGAGAEPAHLGTPSGATSEPRERAGAATWGEFWPAIRRWEHVLGRPTPAPVDGKNLSSEFVEWHMGFPQGWTSILDDRERLKVLGNAVVPQCAEVVGRWALDLVEAALVRQEVA